MPGYATLGVWAPIILVTLRFLQGSGVGGEWGGAALMAVEHTPDHRRGFYGSWPQVGVPAGLLLGTVVFAIVSATVSDAAFSAWGWRVPFLFSALLIVVGLFTRLKISESPVFEQAMQQREEAQEEAQLPVLEAIRLTPRPWGLPRARLSGLTRRST